MAGKRGSVKPFYPVDMKWPITQKFGVNVEAYPLRKGHPGIDFGMPKRKPWYAVWDGDIQAASYRKSGGYGREIFLKVLGRWCVIYGHADELLVSVGEHVKRGQLIGYSGGGLDDPYRGNSTDEHTHFEVRDLTQPQTLPLIGAVDPETWLASDLDQTVDVVPSNEPVINSDVVTVVSNWVSIRRKPTTVGNEPVGKALYGMDFQKAGDKLPRTGTVKGWQPVIMYIATGQDEDGDYLE